jgi:hypothetical protein
MNFRTDKDKLTLFSGPVRHRNRLTQVLETEYRPINPDTLQPDVPMSQTEWLFDDQIDVLNHCFTPADGQAGGLLPYDTVVISDLKKSGKTAIGAGIAYAWARVYGGEMYALANARDQARDRAFSRVNAYLDYLQRDYEDLYEQRIEHRGRNVIIFKNPYARLEAIPCAAGSQAGTYVSLSLWDELWNYDLESAHRLWAEFSPIPQLYGRSCRLVVTYAGYYGESSLLWSLYEQVVRPDADSGQEAGDRPPGLEHLPCYRNEQSRTFAYWNHQPSRPWLTPEFLESRRNDPSVPAHEYKRLWENRWTTGMEGFLPLDTIDRLMAAGKADGLHNRHP